MGLGKVCNKQDLTYVNCNYLCNYFLRFYTHWCRMHFQSSILFYVCVICTPPQTLPSCLGLEPAQVPFLVPVVRFWGVHETEISIQISALSRVRTLNLEWP